MTTSFHSDPALKASLLAQGRHHREADMIVQRTYDHRAEDGAFVSGCTIGCYDQAHTDPQDKRNAIALTYGLPLRLTGVVDAVFEGLSP